MHPQPDGLRRGGDRPCVEGWRASNEFELITLTAYDDGHGGTLFGAAFAPANGRSDWEHDLTKDQLLAAVTSRDAAGLRPAQISGYGTPPRYAALWIPKDDPTLVELSIDWNTLAAHYDGYTTMLLVSAEQYVEDGAVHFAAIWLDKGTPGDVTGLYGYYTANGLAGGVAKNGPPNSLSVIYQPVPSYVGVWYFAPGAWAYRVDLQLGIGGSFDVQTYANKMRLSGYQLRHISASGSGAAAFFAGTWSKP